MKRFRFEKEEKEREEGQQQQQRLVYVLQEINTDPVVNV